MLVVGLLVGVIVVVVVVMELVVDTEVVLVVGVLVKGVGSTRHSASCTCKLPLSSKTNVVLPLTRPLEFTNADTATSAPT